MNISPIAFEFGPFQIFNLVLGPFQVYWYGILMALAVGIGTVLAYREAIVQKLNPDHLINVIILGVPLGWLGARIYYVIFNWDYYGQNPGDIFAIWKGGLAIHGGILAALLVGYLYSKRYKLNFAKLADIVAPSLILGQAIGRWGNFFNQEAFGYPTDLPWAMYIAGEFRHPTFLYESLWNLGIFIFLLWFRRRNFLKSGDVFLSYIGLYSVGRFIVEGFRTDSLMLGPLRAAQVLSIVLFLISAVLLYLKHTRNSKENEPNEKLKVERKKGKKKKK